MKKLFYIFGLLICLQVSINAQTNPSKQSIDKAWSLLNDTTFNYLIKSNNLIFAMPANFEKTAVKVNSNVFYQYAIKDKKSNFEIRIFIKPFKDFYKDPKAFNPNDFSYNFLISVALNASGNISSNIPQVTVLPENIVKQDCNADWGGTSSFVPKFEFGNGFTYCTVNGYRKNNLCEVYVFYLFDDYEKQKKNMNPSLNVIKFKN